MNTNSSDPLDTWVPAAALLALLWPILTYGLWRVCRRPFFGAELLATWRTTRRQLWVVVTFTFGLGVLLNRLDGPGAILGRLVGAGKQPVVERWLTFVSPIPTIWPQAWALLCAGLLVPVAVAVAVKLWSKWIGGRTTDAERAGGAAGLRAWLTPANLAAAAALGVCASQGFDVSFLAVTTLAVAAFAGYPMATTIAAASSAEPAADAREPGIHDERSRVLQLLEDGKITAADAAELIAALTGSHTAVIPAGPRRPFTTTRKLGYAGLALVTVGFFLPWFQVNVAAELARLGWHPMADVPQFPQGWPMPPTAGMPQTSQVTAPVQVPALAQGMSVAPGGIGGTVSIAGGDVGHALGWITLALSAVAALVGDLFPHVRRLALLRISIGSLVVGTVIVAYLVTGNPRQVAVGLVIVGVGYAVQVAATLGAADVPWRHRPVRPAVSA